MRLHGLGRSAGAALLVVCLVCGPRSPIAALADDRLAKAESGVVVSMSRPASDAGLETLRRGGNAVDAAVTTALALAVAWPEAGAVAGGGFLLVQPAANAEPVAIDCREAAPAGATVAVFSPEPGATEHRLVATPGAIQGLWQASRAYGKLPWKELVSPAERLAREGFEVDAALAHSLNAALRETLDLPEFQRLYRRPEGAGWSEGDRLIQPDLARTLRALADEGADAFYRGSLAGRIVAEVSAGGGSLSAADLAGYAAKIREPVHGVYRGYDIYAAPAPSCGGVALVEMLNILEPFELRAFERWSPFTVHLMSEAMRRANDDSQRFLGDPDFDSLPLHLTSKQYSRQIARQIDPRHAGRPTKQDPPGAPVRDGGGSTQFCVCDASGMAVSSSLGLGRPFGSRIAPPGLGFVLNCALESFAAPESPPSHDAKGAPAPAARSPNQLEPGKRMRSAASPVLVSRDGRLTLVCGEAGNSSSAGATLCVLINILEFGVDPRSALDAPRWRPSAPQRTIQFEGYGLEAYSGAVRGLQLMGHSVTKPPGPLEDVHAIWIQPGAMLGAADQRTSGAAAGF